MAKKMIKLSCIIQVILAIVICFSISFSFGSDRLIMASLKRTDFISTLLRLTIFIIPSIHLIGGLFGLVFKTKQLLIASSIVELISAICLLIFLHGESLYMLCLAIITIVVVLIYLVGSIIYEQPDFDNVDDRQDDF